MSAITTRQGPEKLDFTTKVAKSTTMWLHLQGVVPNVSTAALVPVSPGFPLKACVNDATLPALRLYGECAVLKTVLDT